MNSVVNINPVQTMSSLEIAELTGKTHSHVVRDIRRMLEDLGDDPNLDHVEFIEDSRGYTSEIKMPRREVEILLTGYSVPLRAKVIDRLNELESASRSNLLIPDFSNPAEAARAWANEYEQRQIAQQALQLAQPKVAVYDELVETDGTMGYQQFCTHLNLKQREVKHWMKDIGWLRANQYTVNPMPTAKTVQDGYCVVKTYTNGTIMSQSIRFTAKALAYASEHAPSYVRKVSKK